ncbi:dihydropteroate synthase [Candidatus Poribacteria bacterium]|nr:dihydropteroate synthase [Candidatus Poribacteria bacterium]
MTSSSRALLCRGRLLDYTHRTLIMGVLNVTPDSFSDGGALHDPAAAVAAGRRMLSEGAHILDIGGESTRPGADPVEEREEIRRVVPVIETLADVTEATISVDTYKPAVAEAALAAGAHMVNDITGLADADMADVATRNGAAVAIMHMQGSPRTMQDSPTYDDVVTDIAAFLQERANFARERGVDARSIMVDPGIGFGKTALGHNLDILRRLDELAGLGWPLLVGPSRKSFIGAILDDAPPGDRLEGTAAAVAIAITGGAHAVRVHDVREMSRVARVADAIRYA